jgi:hypothetical protein
LRCDFSSALALAGCRKNPPSGHRTEKRSFPILPVFILSHVSAQVQMQGEQANITTAFLIISFKIDHLMTFLLCSIYQQSTLHEKFLKNA